MIDYLQRMPFVRILLPFLAGILLETHIHWHEEIPVFIGIFFLFAVLILVVRGAGFRRDILTGVLFTLFFFFSGIFVTQVKNKPAIVPKGEYYEATLLEKPVEKPKSYRAEVLVTSFFSGDSVFSSRERLIVYFSKNDTVAKLEPGGCIVFGQSPVEIKNQGNPFEFDYAKYMANRGILRQVYLSDKSWITAGEHRKFSISVQAEKARDFLLEIYQRNGLQGTEFEILSALTLGYKKSMDPEIKQVFAATGASHVLAVSGLHVGIVYLVFNLFFGFMRNNKRTRYPFVVLAVSFLWVFAFITGLSPSVQRSALMFTIVLIGENLRRPANIYNTLAASFFILTAINPQIIFDVGFQLSYAAVFGIVYFQPRLNSLFSFSSKPLHYLWGLFTVSLAAQITTFPLSCYYFNQFPTYFWLSNFIVIPLAFVFIFLGIMILATSPFAVISGFLAKMAIFLVKFLFLSLQWIERIPGSLVKGFNFPFSILVITFAVIVSLMLFMETRKQLYLRRMVVLLILPFGITTWMKIRQNHQKEIIAYKTDEPVLHLIYGRTNYLLASATLLKNEFPEWQVNPVIKHLCLKNPVIIPFENDFADRVVIKKGNYLFFDGTIICIPAEEIPLTDEIIPDIIISKNRLITLEELPGKTKIVSYARPIPNKKNIRKIHYINEEGAWRSR
jgi:competence protein ComEC